VSRIGKQPIPVPSGVEINIEGSSVTVKGPKGQLSQSFNEEMIIEMDNGEITVRRPSDSRGHRSLHGLTRTLIANMVTGVSEGFARPPSSRSERAPVKTGGRFRGEKQEWID